ncbi:hypothetical protein GOBAR_AA07053 [Gossypium barbadense]|uniref:Uncharacterized protein n=1 Tax=Gossypium barbadense TaxID=3634 RepID=A0A2P5YD43_GOSBA|nr:hypothetical protein GOBAR_AA07053 [Gossypium barbadense]
MEVSSRSKNTVSNPISREETPSSSPSSSPANGAKIAANSITEPHKKDISPSSESSGDQLEHSNGGSGENPKKSWTKKLKLMKQSSIGSKLKKASRVYLSYLFGNYKSTKKTPLEQDMNGNGHRRSFSMASKRHSSGSSNGQQHLLVLKQSSSVNAEMESPIQGAIAHCKQSQQAWVRSRRTVSEVGVFSFSASDMKCSIQLVKMKRGPTFAVHFCLLFPYFLILIPQQKIFNKYFSIPRTMGLIRPIV